MSYDQVKKTHPEKVPHAFQADPGIIPPPPLKRCQRYRPNLALSPRSQTRELYEFAKHPDFVRSVKA